MEPMLVDRVESPSWVVEKFELKLVDRVDKAI